MALNFNGTNVPQSGAVNLNGAAAKAVQANGVVVWRKELTLFGAGAYGDLGALQQGNKEGASFAVAEIRGQQLLLNCDGRVDYWFPNPASGYSTLHISVASLAGAAGVRELTMGANASRSGWVNRATYTASFERTGESTLSIPSSALYIGLQALRGGAYIDRIWLT